MAEHFSKLGRGMDFQDYETQIFFHSVLSKEVHQDIKKLSKLKAKNFENSKRNRAYNVQEKTRNVSADLPGETEG
jgi:hypothetical protein